MNIFQNDKTEDIKHAISETKEQIEQFLGEIDSCKDCIEEAEAELKRRET